MNLHLLEDINAAEQLEWKTAYKYKTIYDKEIGMIDLQNESGDSLKLRIPPIDLLMRTDRVGRYWHYRNFVDSQISYEVIGPYLIRFGDLPYRKALGEWIRKIPLSIVMDKTSITVLEQNWRMLSARRAHESFRAYLNAISFLSPGSSTRLHGPRHIL